jgi:hypothetical protein
VVASVAAEVNPTESFTTRFTPAASRYSAPQTVRPFHRWDPLSQHDDVCVTSADALDGNPTTTATTVASIAAIANARRRETQRKRFTLHRREHPSGSHRIGVRHRATCLSPEKVIKPLSTAAAV